MLIALHDLFRCMSYPAEERINADILSADTIKSLLPADFSGDVFVKEVTKSTNADAACIAKEAAHGTVVIADAQTEGRGRLGKSFFAPRGGIYMSVILKLGLAFSDAVLVTTAASVAVCKAVEAVSDVQPKIKWVNDILVDEKKVCGISCEAVSSGDTVDSVILGIGVNFSSQDFPKELRETAGVLFTEPRVSRNELIAEILKNILSETEDLLSRKFINEYRKRSAVLGNPIRYLENNIWHDADAIGIDENGGLVILENGKEKILVSGEITLRIK